MWFGIFNRRETDVKKPVSRVPFGALELDEAGRILSYTIPPDQISDVQPSDVVGRNFFTEFALAIQTEEIRDRFNDLISDGDHHKSSLFLLCTRPTIRILLLQTSEHAIDRRRSVLVQIEREE